MTTPAGVCRFCGCSDFDPCLEGCGWTDRGCRVCSICAPAAKAEGKHLRTSRAAGYVIDAAWLRASHRGFLVGWFAVSPRSRYGRNPWRRGPSREAWRLGQQAGSEAGRVERTTFGPVLNRPGARRLAWLLTVDQQRDRAQGARVAH